MIQEDLWTLIIFASFVSFFGASSWTPQAGGNPRLTKLLSRKAAKTMTLYVTKEGLGNLLETMFDKYFKE